MVHDLSNSTVGQQKPVLFQNINISNKITYNPNTGDFYIPEAGIYIIHWWINARNLSSQQKRITRLIRNRCFIWRERKRHRCNRIGNFLESDNSAEKVIS